MVDMEAKRRKLEPEALDAEQAKSGEATAFDSSLLLEAIGSAEFDRISHGLFALKKLLSTKEQVLAFLERDRRCFRAIISLIISLGNEKMTRTKDGNVLSEQRVDSILREAFSLLANACHLSVLACAEVRTKDGGLSHLYVRFLESKSPLVPLPIKVAVLRLLGNLCELKETALIVAMNKQLLDQIANSLELEDEQAVQQAFRILRLLAKRSQLSKNVLRSNGCYQIAKYIAANKDKMKIFRSKPEILQTLNSLLKFQPSQIGPQLANCREFITMCLDFLLNFPVNEPQKAEELERHWLEFILRCTECSHHIRTVFGREAISKVLEHEQNQKQLSDIHCRFLCSFTEDNHCRAYLREFGGLKKMLERLEPPELDDGQRLTHMRIQGNILQSLRFLLYEDSLTLVIKHPSFMPVVLHHIQRYLDTNGPKCHIELVEAGEEIGPRLPSALDQVDDSERNEQAQQDEMIPVEQLPLHKDFSAGYSQTSFLNSPSSSPPRAAWSPSMSPSTSGIFSSSTSPGASPPGASPEPASPTIFFIHDNLFANLRQKSNSPVDNGAAPGDLEPDDPTAIFVADEGFSHDNEQEEGNIEEEKTPSKEEKKLRQKIVQSSLYLITHFSHQEERQSIFLLKKEIMDCLVRHISEAPELNNRLARALRRLARHQTGLQLLLEMDFHMMIVTRLIRRPCTLARFASPCARCDIRLDFGRLLLSDHALLADSQMGEYILLKLRMDAAAQLSDPREAHFARLRTLMAALVLIRREERRPRFYYNFRPVESLLDALSQFMREESPSKPNNQENLFEDSEEGQLCCDIVATLASLLSHQHLDPLIPQFPRTTREEGQQNDDEKCLLEGKSNEQLEKEGETLNFRNKRRQLLAKVPKAELCTFNEYFSGMFGSEFVERLQSRSEFTFDADEEACSEGDFLKFLHFSIGCPLQSDCTRVDSAECCAALLYLADKYLCTRLLDHLLAGGLAARFVTGKTLRLFLPLVLSVPTVGDGGGMKDICILVLFRYSNNSELLCTLRHVVNCGDATVNALMTLLKQYLASHTAPRSVGPNANLVYRDF